MKLRVVAIASAALFALAACGSSDLKSEVQDHFNGLPEDEKAEFCQGWEMAEWEDIEGIIRQAYEDEGGTDWDSEEAHDALDSLC
ncbi:hypothetical protein [Natronoglycomyces albus]|uniref:Lipoprotein n=1 Tax=Natronoglycomyces albus TaxID=2811108 RepID=A0A895XT76_9ACTN|nr:hypothetical protein [Natronoglycomyces albus]QSB06693.1 hypothetical protein JQS30_07305 [Natronoglycomyces albus]